MSWSLLNRNWSKWTSNHSRSGKRLTKLSRKGSLRKMICKKWPAKSMFRGKKAFLWSRKLIRLGVKVNSRLVSRLKDNSLNDLHATISKTRIDLPNQIQWTTVEGLWYLWMSPSVTPWPRVMKFNLVKCHRRKLKLMKLEISKLLIHQRWVHRGDHYLRTNIMSSWMIPMMGPISQTIAWWMMTTMTMMMTAIIPTAIISRARRIKR